MSKTVLIVAFDFPPSSSAAVQRTLKMADYLKDFGWQAVILTAKENAYEATEDSQKIPEHVKEHVYRTAALDVHNHLSIRGKHFNWMKGIDRWSTWIPGAISCGRKLLNQYQFDAIVSTAPIPSAHIIASKLAAKSGIPWMADYQDPMAYLYEPTSKLRKFCHQRIDTKVTSSASALVYATKQAMNLYQNAFPDTKKSIFHFVENGFDETNFELLNGYQPKTPTPFSANKFSFYYSGVLYPNGRDPIPLFKAIAQLVDNNQLNIDNFEVIFQGSGTGEKFNNLLEELKINNIIKFMPSVPYVDSLHNMVNADALVLIQDQVFNLQVPGKLYEYIRTGKSILAITPNESATAEVANRAHNSFIATEANAIAQQILQIINREIAVSAISVESFSRYSKTQEFSQILNGISHEG
jgi:hypothetical protein